MEMPERRAGEWNIAKYNKRKKKKRMDKVEEEKRKKNAEREGEKVNFFAF